MKTKIVKLIAAFFLMLMLKTEANYYFNDSLANEVDPVIAQLDSMSFSLFTRDKYFVNDDEVLASINMPLELIPRYSDEVVRENMKLIPAEFQLHYNTHVKQFIEMFAYKRRGLMTRCLANAQIYFPLFEEILDKKGVPLELKYLPIVESAFNPAAVSRVGASGLWQFMYSTGVLFGLNVNTYVDERRDPVKSTNAAADYLKKLYDIYGDWQLVLAAYNSGPGNVNKAIARAGGGKKSFWQIMYYLPAETRSYVPSYIAAVYVMNYYKDYKLVSAEPKRELYAVDTVLITAKVSLKHISSILSIPEDELQFLNPSLKKGIIPYTVDGFPMNLPVNYFALFEAKKEDIMNDPSMKEENTEQMLAASTPKWIYYKVKKDESLSKIAAKYGVSSSSLRKWNNLKNSYVYPGQKLKIMTSVPETTSPAYTQAFNNSKPFTGTKTASPVTTKADSSVIQPALATTSDSITDSLKTNVSPFAPTENGNGKCIFYVVQPGDTLWNITQKYNLTIDKLKSYNTDIQSRPIRVGDILKIFL